MRVRFTVIVWLACLAVIMPASARAQGHMLHGAGPVNSAMGGAGTALTNDSLGALMFNPAAIAGVKGNQITFATEFFQDAIKIDTTIGSITGHTNPTLNLGVIPAFGWMLRDPRGKLALGFGLIGIAGFRTDYPQDTASLVFSPQPNGFGRIFTDYRLTKIPVAFAYQVTPKLAVGASLNVYRGEFAVSPLPYKVFDVSAISGGRFYPEAGNLVPRWAFGGQFGFLYQADPMLSVGGSITTPQNFSPYTWNSFIADPTSKQYGQARTLDFDLDGPMIASFGVGLKAPSGKTMIGIDGMFTKYKGVEGFGSPGGIVDRIVYPFGWRNIWTVKAGLQHELTDKLTVRAGYNYSQTPLRKEVILTGTGAPATFQNHFCGGFGLKMFPFLTAEAAFYYVPREHVVGPFPDLDNKVLGTMDTSNQLTSGIIGLNFRF